MDINPLLPWYRLNFQERISPDKEKPRGPDKDPTPSILFGDLLSIDRLRGTIVPAPQDLGEAKHAALDEDAGPDDQESSLPIREIEETAPLADATYGLVIAETVTASRSARRRAEDHVRRVKRARLECPYRTRDGYCSAVSIRCGEREQLSSRETRQQREQPHRCHYDPANGDTSVLIVVANATMREFCRSTIELFLGIDNKRILLADTAVAGVGSVNRAKIAGHPCGFVVADEELSGMTGFGLVNELYERNCNVDVLLLQDPQARAAKPDEYFGDVEIAPGRPLVRGALAKPFHSAQLVERAQAARS